MSVSAPPGMTAIGAITMLPRPRTDAIETMTTTNHGQGGTGTEERRAVAAEDTEMIVTEMDIGRTQGTGRGMTIDIADTGATNPKRRREDARRRTRSESSRTGEKTKADILIHLIFL